MKVRMALNWFSCFCLALSNSSSKPFSSLRLWRMDSVLATRQSDSAPTCEKPTVMSVRSSSGVCRTPG